MATAARPVLLSIVAQLSLSASFSPPPVSSFSNNAILGAQRIPRWAAARTGADALAHSVGIRPPSCCILACIHSLLMLGARRFCGEKPAADTPDCPPGVSAGEESVTGKAAVCEKIAARAYGREKHCGALVLA